VPTDGYDAMSGLTERVDQSATDEPRSAGDQDDHVDAGTWIDDGTGEQLARLN
jgi:hypothetical protein